MNKIFDIEKARSITNNDTDLLLEILNMFIAEENNMTNVIKNAINENNYKQLVLSAHSLKGSLLNLGGNRAANNAHQLEKIGRENDTTHALTIYSKLKEEIDVFKIEIDKYLNNYQP